MTDNALFDVDDTLTVGQVNRRLSEAVRRSFSKDVWVQGQIRNLSRSGRGHVYFDLCDPTPAGAQPKASISVTLFDSNRQIVNRIITRTGNTVRIDDGVEVRIKATVEMYVPRGQVQLNMTSIDPEFTLGRLSADRDQLLRELKAEHLLDANQLITMPLVPLRVALITSGGSAAHADFHEQIAASGYAFEITTLSTRVQGEFAPEEIADMIAHGSELDVDVLAVVRGGGARTDLAAFDTAPVARAITSATKPVLCGIGHEIDTSVADLVAHASLKTPTACAQYLIERVITFDFALAQRAGRLAAVAITLPQDQDTLVNERASLLGQRVAQTLHRASQATALAAGGLERRVTRAIARSEQRLATTQGHVAARSSSALTAAWRHCDQQQTHVAERPRRVLREQTSQLELLEAKLSAVDPAQALQRGYSITTTTTGQLVRRSDQVPPGTELITQLAVGTVTSTVTASDSTNQERHD
jgi:exodeoxyribonuclease VII large subunit